MKSIFTFLKTTTLGGLFLLLPGVILMLVVAKAAAGVKSTAEALMDKLAGPDSEAAHLPMIYAVLIVMLLSFFLGLLLSSKRGETIGKKIEGTLMTRMPGYAAVHSIIGGIANSGGDDVIRPALMTVDEGVQSFVFITEDLGDRYAVYAPESPSPGGGEVLIVAKPLIQPLNVRMTEVSTALQQLGLGSRKLLARHAANLPAAGSS